LLLLSALAGWLLAAAGCAVTPQPFSVAEWTAQAQGEAEQLYSDQEPVGERLDFYEALARAVKYNLDHQVKLVEQALARGHLLQARYDLLPQLVASAGYSRRNNENGSASKSLLSGTQSLESSTSQHKDSFSSEIIYVWNVLDFGVSYVQARQVADETLIAEEWRRKAVENIVQDVRRAYWRAVVAEMLLPEMDALLARVQSALARSRQVESLRLQEPMKTLAYQQELLETVKQLWRMRKELALAKTELAALINLKPGSAFRIGMEKLPVVVAARFDPAALEEQALVQRPELRVEAYQERIGRLEVRKALLRMLPGLEFNVSANYDDNSYLYNNSWLQLGGRLSWNAFNLLSGPAAVRTATIQQELAVKRRMAVAMMALTQVHLARQRYGLAWREYRIAAELAAVHRRKLAHAAAAREADAGSELVEIENVAAALAARMYEGLAYADLQTALGRILHSTGIDPLPAVPPDIDVHALGLVMKRHEAEVLAAWRGGDEAGDPPRTAIGAGYSVMPAVSGPETASPVPAPSPSSAAGYEVEALAAPTRQPTPAASPAPLEEAGREEVKTTTATAVVVPVAPAALAPAAVEHEGLAKEEAAAEVASADGHAELAVTRQSPAAKPATGNAPATMPAEQDNTGGFRVRLTAPGIASGIGGGGIAYR